MAVNCRKRTRIVYYEFLLTITMGSQCLEVYPHLVVICFVAVILLLPNALCDLFDHILQGRITGAGDTRIIAPVAVKWSHKVQRCVYFLGYILWVIIAVINQYNSVCPQGREGEPSFNSHFTWYDLEFPEQLARKFKTCRIWFLNRFLEHCWAIIDKEWTPYL